jgi:hypothetical protein
VSPATASNTASGCAIYRWLATEQRPNGVLASDGVVDHAALRYGPRSGRVGVQAARPGSLAGVADASVVTDNLESPTDHLPASRCATDVCRAPS